MTNSSNRREPATYENTGVTGGQDSITSLQTQSNTVESHQTVNYEVLAPPTAQYENVDTSGRIPALHNEYASLAGPRNNNNHVYEAVDNDAILSANVAR